MCIIILIRLVQAVGTFFFLALFTSFHTHSLFFCFFVLFHSCCSHARVLGKTLVHEFFISYSHTEWYLFFPDSATTQKRIRCEMAILAQALVTLYKLNLVSQRGNRLCQFAQEQWVLALLVCTGIVCIGSVSQRWNSVYRYTLFPL